MPFKKGDRVSYRNGHGLRFSDYEGIGVVKYVREYTSGDLLFLEDHDGIGSGIQVFAKDCEEYHAPQTGEKNATD